VLRETGCKVAIERKANNINLNNLCIQEIFTNQALEKKLTITFEGKNYLLLNEEKKNKFLDTLSKELCQQFHINKKDILLLNPRGPGFTLDLCICGLDEGTQKAIYNYIKSKKDIISIKNSILLEGCKLSFDLFEPSFDMKPENWPRNPGMRGGIGYFPPEKYFGFALKVKGSYDNGDDTWLGHTNKKGEFAVAYHGVRAPNVLNVVNLIMNSHLRNGQNNACEFDEDVMNPGHICGKGVYVTPVMDIAEKYTKEVYIRELKKKYRIAFQCRVNPAKIRQSDAVPEYWILDGNGQEIRPYRILVREC
jgi:hypothetical protein